MKDILPSHFCSETKKSWKLRHPKTRKVACLTFTQEVLLYGGSKLWNQEISEIQKT